MQRRMVPVAFGFPAVGREWAAVYSRDFPHSLLHIEGGCMPDQKLVRARFPLYVCLACKRAEHAWAEKHRDTREARAILAGKDAIRPDDSSWIAATPGISPDEKRVLVADYYWQVVGPPPQYTRKHLEQLLRASDDPTLDGEASELQASRVAAALASAGDEMFSEVLASQSERVKRAVAREVSSLWQRFGLHYPKTEHVLQSYT